MIFLKRWKQIYFSIKNHVTSNIQKLHVRTKVFCVYNKWLKYWNTTGSLQNLTTVFWCFSRTQLFYFPSLPSVFDSKKLENSICRFQGCWAVWRNEIYFFVMKWHQLDDGRTDRQKIKCCWTPTDKRCGRKLNVAGLPPTSGAGEKN